MTEQKVKEYTIRFLTSDELGGYPITGKSDAGIIEVYKGEDKVDSAWVVVSKNGLVRFDRI